MAIRVRSLNYFGNSLYPYPDSPPSVSLGDPIMMLEGLDLPVSTSTASGIRNSLFMPPISYGEGGGIVQSSGGIVPSITDKNEPLPSKCSFGYEQLPDGSCQKICLSPSQVRVDRMTCKCAPGYELRNNKCQTKMPPMTCPEGQIKGAGGWCEDVVPYEKEPPPEDEQFIPFTTTETTKLPPLVIGGGLLVAALLLRKFI